MEKEYYKQGDHRIIDGKHYIFRDWNGEGFCFKDEEAYENRPDDICYVPEHAISEDEIEIDGKTYECFGKVDDERSNDIFTHNLILEIAEEYYDAYAAEPEEKELLAEEYDVHNAADLCDRAFQAVEWQFPSTYIEEFFNYI